MKFSLVAALIALMPLSVQAKDWERLPDGRVVIELYDVRLTVGEKQDGVVIFIPTQPWQGTIKIVDLVDRPEEVRNAILTGKAFNNGMVRILSRTTHNPTSEKVDIGLQIDLYNKSKPYWLNSYIDKGAAKTKVFCRKAMNICVGKIASKSGKVFVEYSFSQEVLKRGTASNQFSKSDFSQKLDGSIRKHLKSLLADEELLP